MKLLFKYLVQRLPFYILILVIGGLIYSNKVYEIAYWLCFKSNVSGVVLLILAVLSTILVVRAASNKK